MPPKKKEDLFKYYTESKYYITLNSYIQKDHFDSFIVLIRLVKFCLTIPVHEFFAHYYSYYFFRYLTLCIVLVGTPFSRNLNNLLLNILDWHKQLVPLTFTNWKHGLLLGDISPNLSASMNPINLQCRWENWADQLFGKLAASWKRILFYFIPAFYFSTCRKG